MRASVGLSLAGALAIALTAPLVLAPPLEEMADTDVLVVETETQALPTDSATVGVPGAVTIIETETAFFLETEGELTEPVVTTGEPVVTGTTYVPETGLTTTGAAPATTGAYQPPALLRGGGIRTDYDPAKVGRVVEVRNECSDAVYLYYGPTPPLHAQDVLVLNAEAQTTPFMIPGDVLWIYDDDGLPVGNATVGPATETIVVSSSCTEVFTEDAL